MAAISHSPEVRTALNHMTPETKEMFPPSLLSMRIGRGTVASALNDQVRFRVEGSGDERKFVPDSQLAVKLMGTEAGPKLVRQLEAGARTADWIPEKTHLKGFILPRDTTAVAAGGLIAGAEQGGPPEAFPQEPIPKNRVARQKLLREEYAYVKEAVKPSAAWNSRGWVTFMPDYARLMLTSAGAYDPSAKQEPRLRRGRMIEYAADTVAHEVQHSITPRKGRYPEIRWMEEGIANMFSEPKVFARENRLAAGVSKEAYAAQLRHEPVVDLGWGPWKREQLKGKAKEENDKTSKQRYVDSMPILHGLLDLAGARLNTTDGKDKARQLLQGSELDRVPGNLANAIIGEHHLKPSTYEPLRNRIKRAVDDPKSISLIRKEFGIKD